MQMEEPLMDLQIGSGDASSDWQRALKFMPNAKAAGSEYRHAGGTSASFSPPMAVMLDEAQHLAAWVRGADFRISWM